MKKSINLSLSCILSVALLSVTFMSCVKDRDGATDFSGLQPIVQIVEGGLPTSGAFAKAALLFPGTDISDTASFRLNYAGTTVAPTDITVTLAYDAAALAAYNATVPLPARYFKFPDSIYKFTQTTVVIKAGESYSDLVKLVVYPSKIDPSVNYMLPITITAAQGLNISKNFGTIYFHFIGNCLAGAYNNVGTRYNYTGCCVNYTGGPFPPGFTTAVCGTPKVLAPLSATVTTTYYANLGAGTNRDYYFTYDCAGGGNNVDVTFTQSFLDGTSNVAFITHTYDPILKRLRMVSTYNNALGGGGNDRIVEETMTKQ